MHKRTFDSIDERLDFIEYRQELLFENTSESRNIFEVGLTREEYHKIIKLIESIRERIINGEVVHYYDYETKVDEIIYKKGDYHMNKSILHLYDLDLYEKIYNSKFL